MIEALRRTGVRFVILGVAAYLVFLVANLPAAWLGYALESSSGGAVALGEARGTVWKGRGALAIRSGGSFRSVADVEWRCNPLAIFVGRLSVTLSGSAPGVSLRVNASLGFGSVRLQNLEASGPTALLEQAVPILAIWKPQGQVRVAANSFEMGPAAVRGAATVDWAEAGAFGVPRAGDYRLQITGNGDQATIRLSTLKGELRVDGNGEWRASQPKVVQMRGMVVALPPRKDLEPLVQWLAGPGTGPSRQFGWMLTL